MRRRAYAMRAGAALALLGGMLWGSVPAASGAPGDGLAPGGVGPHTYARQDLSFTVATGPGDDLAVTISAYLYVPDGVTAAAPAPAVLTTHGFGNTKDSPEQLANSAYFASHGYVVLSYDSQGFGSSSSCIGLDSLSYDVKNARQLIDYLASLSYVDTNAPGDPRVGIIGGSYGGGAQGLIAATDPRVDAIAIGRSWHTLQYSLDPNNWIVDPANPWDLDAYDQGVFKQEWTSLFFGLGTSMPAQGYGGCDPITQAQEFPLQPPCPGFIPPICEIYARLSATGDATASDKALVGDSSLATVIDDLDAPTLLVQGLPDTLFNVDDATATYMNLRDRHVPTAMIWHSGGHGGYYTPASEAEAYSGQWDDTAASQAEFSQGYLPRRTLQWFERYVRGADVNTGPGFAWHRNWLELPAGADSAAPVYGTAAKYPPPNVPVTTYTIDPGAGALTAPGGTVTGGSAIILNPQNGEPAAYSETPNFSGPNSDPSFSDVPPTEVEGQYAAFDTAPFGTDTELVGIPQAHLRLGHVAPTGDVRFFLKLYDVDPDGSTTLLFRQVAPARVPDAALGGADVRLVGTSHLLAAGHRLRLVIATTDQAYWNSRVADAITLSSSALAPSTIDLPLRPL